MWNLRRDLFALLILAAITIAQGFYASKLNVDFYKEHAPFFDSCSYGNQFAIVAYRARSLGFLAGIKDSLSGDEGRNVSLPFLEATLLAPLVAPSRVMQVWLQSIWMVALALSLYWYFARYRLVNRWIAILLALPFISFARIYDWNGGLPDFRMDLSLYIFASLTAIWYLGTYETESRVPWILAGVSAMLACLARATAPIYLLVMLGPLLAIRLAMARGKRRVIVENVLWMCVPVMIAIGAFLAYNFSYLYFYYVTWSPDANRHLPWSQSAIHFAMAESHMGIVTMWCALAAGAINFACVRRRFPMLDWKPVWLAIAPPLFLMVRGAGLNPFVSMPAVFGFFLFACVPFVGIQPAARFLWGRAAIGILFASGAIAAAASAGRPQLYTGSNMTSMPGVRAIIDRASRDANAKGWPRVEMYAPMLGDFHSCSVSNVLTYEYGAIPRDDKAMYIPHGLIYHFPMELTFMAPDELFWKSNLHGDSVQERLDDAVSIIAASPDYVFLPDEATLKWLEQERSMYYINRKTRELRSRLLALGNWVKLGDPVPVSPNEKIEVYAYRGVY
jgi:hypothetical protein